MFVFYFIRVFVILFGIIILIICKVGGFLFFKMKYFCVVMVSLGMIYYVYGVRLKYDEFIWFFLKNKIFVL